MSYYLITNVILVFTVSDLNAVTRSIDLMSQMLAPTAVGMVMTYASLLTGALTIAGWNLFSIFIEYSLLVRVYRLVPRLAHKGGINPPIGKDGMI